MMRFVLEWTSFGWFFFRYTSLWLQFVYKNLVGQHRVFEELLSRCQLIMENNNSGNLNLSSSLPPFPHQRMIGPFSVLDEAAKSVLCSSEMPIHEFWSSEILEKVGRAPPENTSQKQHPTEWFTVCEPQNPLIDKYHVVKKRRWTDYGALNFVQDSVGREWGLPDIFGNVPKMLRIL